MLKKNLDFNELLFKKTEYRRTDLNLFEKKFPEIK